MGGLVAPAQWIDYSPPEAKMRKLGFKSLTQKVLFLISCAFEVSSNYGLDTLLAQHKPAATILKCLVGQFSSKIKKRIHKLSFHTEKDERTALLATVGAFVSFSIAVLALQLAGSSSFLSGLPYANNVCLLVFMTACPCAFFFMTSLDRTLRYGATVS